MTPETKLKIAVIAHLKKLKAQGSPIWWLKLHGGAMQRAGVPDLLVVYQGRAFFFELKAPGAKAEPLQRHTINQIRKAGGVAVVARNVADVADELFER